MSYDQTTADLLRENAALLARVEAAEGGKERVQQEYESLLQLYNTLLISAEAAEAARDAISR